MHTNPATDAANPSRPPQSQGQNNTAEARGEQSTSASAPASSQKQSKRDSSTHTYKQAIRLLIALCLGALASFSLVPSLQVLSQAKNTGPASQYSNGGCTMLPQSIQYEKPTTTNQSTPSSWTKAGQNSQQFALAQACATAFAIAYETININDIPSLTNSTYMLSATGKQHFFVGTPEEPKAIYLNATWQKQAKQVHLVQNAQAITPAQLQVVQASSNAFFATFTVNYKLTTVISGKSITQQNQLIVVVQQTPITPAVQSTGWMVTDWHDATP
jgi:hypothetical protein